MTGKTKEMEWPGKDTGPNVDAIIRDLDKNAITLGISCNTKKELTVNDLVNHPLLALKNDYPID
jgi:hypothetical protein